MVDFTRMPSPSTMFSAYASLSASIMLVQTTFNQLIPPRLQEYISSIISQYFNKAHSPSKLLLIIEENEGISSNEIYHAAEVYLCTKIDASVHCLKVSKHPKENGLQVRFAESEKITDFYQGVEITWRFHSEQRKEEKSRSMVDEYRGSEKRSFGLSFNKEHKETIMNSYFPFVLQKAKDIKDEEKVVMLYTFSCYDGGAWKSISLKHPTTFDNLAMDKSMKQAIIDDLDRFVLRKDFYRKVGKAWKRGYLLYGPPGTGKSSLVAAIANYLKFDVFDLELASIHRDSDLRRLLLKTPNRSILLIEDIDCSVDLPNRNPSYHQVEKQKPFTLSGLLNFIDGLWSSCADERIIIFTTNNKEKLDPALLRPGRMDMHISMSYLSNDGFKQLLSTYLNIHNYGQHEHEHELILREIEELMGSMNVTPAEVAGELMKSDDAKVCLVGLVNFLKCKKIDVDEQIKDEGAKENEVGLLPKDKEVKLDDVNEHAVVPSKDWDVTSETDY